MVLMWSAADDMKVSRVRKVLVGVDDDDFVKLRDPRTRLFSFQLQHLRPYYLYLRYPIHLHLILSPLFNFLSHYLSDCEKMEYVTPLHRIYILHTYVPSRVLSS